MVEQGANGQSAADTAWRAMESEAVLSPLGVDDQGLTRGGAQ